MLALIQSFLMYKGYKSKDYSNKRSDLSTSWSMQNELQRLIYNLQKMVLIFKTGIHSNHTSMSGVFNFHYMGCTRFLV